MLSNFQSAYPTFERILKDGQQRLELLPNPREIDWALTKVKGQRQLVSFLTLFKCAQLMGYIADLKAVPDAIVQRIIDHLQALQVIDRGKVQIKALSRKALYSKSGYHATIRRRLGMRQFTSDVRSELEKYLNDTATQTQHSAIDLINAAVEWLTKARIELPGLDTLQRICGRVHASSNRSIEAMVMARVSDELRRQLDGLLKPAPDQMFADWIRIRERPGAPTLTALREYLDFAHWVWALGDLAPIVVDVPVPKLRHYSAQAMELPASTLLNFGGTDHQYVIMIAAILDAQQQARDALAEFFCKPPAAGGKRMAQFEKEAQEDLDQEHLRQRSLVERVVTIFRDVLLAMAEKRPLKLVQALWGIILLAGSRESLIGDCDNILGIASVKDRFQLFMWRHFKASRGALFQVLHSLHLRSTTGDPTLLESVGDVLRSENSDGAFVPRETDLGWASAPWRKRVMAVFEDKPVYRKDALELCAFTHLAQDLRSGDVAVVGSAAHADHREQLLEWPKIQGNLGAYSVATGLSTEPAQFVADLRKELETAIDSARVKLKERPLHKRKKDGAWVLPRYVKRTPTPQQAALEAMVQRQLADRGLIEILVNADIHTGFTRRFGPPAGTAPRFPDARNPRLPRANAT